jgi:hypothetical protein
VWENKANGQRIIWLMKNGVPQSALFLPTISTDWHIAGAGDFDGDGQADLIWENTATGQRVIWFMKNGVPQTSDFLLSMPADWHIVDH